MMTEMMMTIMTNFAIIMIVIGFTNVIMTIFRLCLPIFTEKPILPRVHMQDKFRSKYTNHEKNMVQHICCSHQVMCLDIHPDYPNMIAIGLYDGNVAVSEADDLFRCTLHMII